MVKDIGLVFVLVMVIRQGMIKDAIFFYMHTQSEPNLRES
jgi:hypothetical protein